MSLALRLPLALLALAAVSALVGFSGFSALGATIAKVACFVLLALAITSFLGALSGPLARRWDQAARR